MQRFAVFCISIIFGAHSIQETSTHRNKYSSHQDLTVCSGSLPIQYPSSIKEVISLIKTTAKVKAIGTLHSITDIICTDGVPISLAKINHSAYHEDNGSATFGAGIRLSDALTFLHGKNRTFEHVPAWGYITLGGALATAAHGSSLRHPTTLSEEVLSVSVVNASGVLIRVDDPVNLLAFKANLGLLGIIVEITLQTVPLFKVTLTHTSHNADIMFTEEPLKLGHALDFAQFYWFPFLEEVVVVNGTYVNVDTAGDGKIGFEYAFGPVVGTILNAINTSLYWIRNKYLYRLSHYVTKRLIAGDFGGVIQEDETGHLVNPGTGTINNILVTKCDPGNCVWDFDPFQDTSMAFDLIHFHAVLSMMLSVAEEYPEVFHNGVVVIRFLKGSPVLMCTSGGVDSFVVEWLTSTTIVEGNDTLAEGIVAVYDKMMRTLVSKFEGRPHWGKKGVCYFTPNNFPKFKEFVATVKRVDPNGTFQNQFSTRLLKSLGKTGPHFKPFCQFDERFRAMKIKEFPLKKDHSDL